MNFSGMAGSLAATAIATCLSASLAVADEIADAKSLVEEFYANLVAEDYGKLLEQFTPDATAKSTVKYGFGLPDDSWTYTPADFRQFAEMEIPEEYKAYFEGYKESQKVFNVLGAEKDRQDVKISGRMTTDFEMQGYRGKILQNDSFVVSFPETGNPKITAYSGVTSFK